MNMQGIGDTLIVIINLGRWSFYNRYDDVDVN